MSYTYNDLIQQVQRVLMPKGLYACLVTSTPPQNATTLTFDTANPMFKAVRAGSVVTLDLENYLVIEDPNTSTGVANVQSGWQGSTSTSHAANTLALIDPRFTPFDISRAINDEINALASPDVGLGQVKTVDLTYVPVFMGYDLGAGFDSQKSGVLEVSFSEAPPSRRHPTIRRGHYRVIRNQTSSDFPSGNGIIIYRDAWPGFPIHVIYTAPYNPLVNLTDDALAVGGIPVSVQDIVWMGAVLRLAPDREISRNDTGRQADPRKAAEVPPGAVAASANSVQARYFRRRNEEASNLKRAYRQREWL